MAANTFGEIFRITTYGESHGAGVGVVIDGCPSGILIDENLIQQDLKKRRPGQSKIVTQRDEKDEFSILSGVFEGKSTGTPIHIFIPNTDQKSKDYDHLASTYRPSHADYTYQAKYGLRDHNGGGRSSARETAARVAAGAIAKQILQSKGINIVAYVSQVGNIILNDKQTWTTDEVETSIVRCPDQQTSEAMIELISQIKKEGDTIGGIVSCVIEGCPPGLGAPVFDKLHADLAKAIMSINAAKAFEYGSGFASVSMRGSEHNDLFHIENDVVKTQTNHSGGIQGGISNGMPIHFRVGFKPVATIIQEQHTVDADGNDTILKGKGRHDPCVVPRAVPIVEAMAALVIVDHLLRNQTIKIIE